MSGFILKAGLASVVLGSSTVALAGQTQRFALVAGANNGGAERVQLRYAVSDAEAVAEVLGELGGVDHHNTVLLSEPSRDGLEQALGELAGRVAEAKSAGDRTEVLVYYSGHSDETGLLLEGEHYAYPDLREAIHQVPADVRVVMLDSCASGAMVRTKGGTRRAAFLEDESVDVTGYAYLTSSSADEVSQESDTLGGSFFTHYLVSGLRGAADHSLDGRVTLNEAYQYAREETLRRTERTAYGPQHAYQEMQLVGTGDLVMTDLSQTSASLVLGEGLAGRVFVRDSEGRLVAEVSKPSERAVELGVESGRYTVLVEEGATKREAILELGEAEHILLTDLEFTTVEGELAVARGDVPGVISAPPAPEPQVVGVNPVMNVAVDLKGSQFALLGNRVIRDAEGTQITFGANFVGGELQGTQIDLGYNDAGSLEGAQLTLGANRAGSGEGFQGSVGANIAGSHYTGVQGTVGANIVEGTMEGVQLSSGVNIVGGSAQGVQLTAGANVTGGETTGAQVASVNVSSRLKGLQLGIVNVAGKGSGAQVGIVNVADDLDGVGIGLITVHRTGYNHIQAWSSAVEPGGVGLTYGSKYLYTTAQFGFRPLSIRFVEGQGESAVIEERTVMGSSAALGFGVHLPAKPMFVDLDVVGGARVGPGREWGSEGVMVRGRALLGLQVWEHLSPFMGVTVETVMPTNAEVWDPDGPVVLLSDVTTPVVMGWTLGLRF